MIKYSALFVFFTASVLFAQLHQSNSISGKVIDASLKEELMSVSVYISNTTIGTLTDEYGNYKIAKIPPGKHTLVVSIIGYHPELLNLDIKENSVIQKDFNLRSKSIEMNTITVSEYSEDYINERIKNESIFKKYFLGQVNFSDDCYIENLKDVILGKRSTEILYAVSSEPVIIRNNSLGYDVECLIKRFECNDKQGWVSCEFYPKFAEMTSDDKEQCEKWEENRKVAHLNPLNRFLLCLLNSKGSVTDYQIKFFKRSPWQYNFKKEVLIQHDSSSGLYYLKSDRVVEVRNVNTNEESTLFIPHKIAYLNPEGYPFDPLSIQVSGSMGVQGLSSLLPSGKVLEFQKKELESVIQ